jgi:hypothetical protein
VPSARLHRGARLHELEREVDGLFDCHLVLLALGIAEVEREVDLVPDVARRQPVQGDAGDVGEQVLRLDCREARSRSG